MPTPTPSIPSARAEVRRLIVLGSTGSIGVQALEVVEHVNALHARGESPVRFEVVGLAAGRNADRLAAQRARWPGARVALADPGDERDSSPVDCARALDGALRGPGSAAELVRSTPCDLVLAAMVGVAGLAPTLAAVELGRDVALANKETLVAAGSLVVAAARRSGSRLLPVDSEHAAVWQCLRAHAAAGADPGSAVPPMTAPDHVRRVVLTASGGPFRTWPVDRIRAAGPADALNHPTWRMGRKVTVDSASLMNKTLELIEAHWLFSLPAERLGVMVHPQSIVHALVEFADGSVVAQLAPPDMRLPIQSALTFPHGIPSLAPRLDWTAACSLQLEPPDLERFPALRLAERVLRAGGGAGAVLNAANEVAVEAFLAGAIPFGAIVPMVEAALDTVGAGEVDSLQAALAADAQGREFVRRRLARSHASPA